jgi:pyrroline-5-carboxylate reductase
MTQVFLSDEQATAIRQATGAVEMLDESGVLVAYVTRPTTFTEEEIAEAERRAVWQGPWHTTEQFLSRLRALEQK